jgi:hypothetical protein
MWFSFFPHPLRCAHPILVTTGLADITVGRISTKVRSGMASNSLIFIPSFVRISQLVQNQIMQKLLVQVYTKFSQNRSVLSEVKHAKITLYFVQRTHKAHS